MYSRKKCRTKNGYLRNSSSNWIFLWRFVIQNHLKLSIIEKRKNKTKFLTQNSISFLRRTAFQNLLKALDLSSATGRVAPDLTKALAFLSDITVKKSAVDREYLKPHWKSKKRPHLSRWLTRILCTKFSKTLLTTESHF